MPILNIGQGMCDTFLYMLRHGVRKEVKWQAY